MDLVNSVEIKSEMAQQFKQIIEVYAQQDQF